MKKELKQALVVSKVTLALLWPTVAWASAITFGESMASIPLLAILMTFTLSTLSGVTGLLHAMKQEYEKKGAIDRLWLLIFLKLFGSNTAGVAMFFIAESAGMDDAKQAVAIIVASFGGTWFLERLLQFLPSKATPTTGASQ